MKCFNEYVKFHENKTEEIFYKKQEKPFDNSNADFVNLIENKNKNLTNFNKNMQSKYNSLLQIIPLLSFIINIIKFYFYFFNLLNLINSSKKLKNKFNLLVFPKKNTILILFNLQKLRFSK